MRTYPHTRYVHAVVSQMNTAGLTINEFHGGGPLPGSTGEGMWAKLVVSPTAPALTKPWHDPLSDSISIHWGEVTGWWVERHNRTRKEVATEWIGAEVAPAPRTLATLVVAAVSSMHHRPRRTPPPIYRKRTRHTDVAFERTLAALGK
ncbi:hypothetical protein [Actinokineospora inagensis]|uniref:hypothetical protein n=1 Tax=Actinokineospora inagensis TaxID=103730 RepID=UPI00040885E6|nr:hypothetical protein [Actinokineospora inagensis]